MKAKKINKKTAWKKKKSYAPKRKPKTTAMFIAYQKALDNKLYELMNEQYVQSIGCGVFKSVRGFFSFCLFIPSYSPCTVVQHGSYA